MSIRKKSLSLILTLAFLASSTLPATIAAAQDAAKSQTATTTAQTATTTTAADSAELQSKLAAIEKTIEEKRRELGVPGVSFVIVKDDRIILMKGFGVKDFERKLPVTPDTLFAIGSSSKAFTAMTVVMSADDGKLSLDDSPKKYLPYFQLRDPEADAKVTVRDLLSHSSGLNRTDIAWITGALNREEVIRVAGLAKPTAKLREKFQYQNVMFSAAGEVAAKVQGKRWEDIVRDRIFKPLGMKASNLTVGETVKAPDYALGYEYDEATKETMRRPMRDFPQVAAAGAINSNARDMAQWLRLMLGGGVFEGKRLVSEKNFNELISPQMKIGGKVSYGLGWFLREWNGHKVAEHGGNIDGFNALVALMPDQRLGFAMLTNVSGSPLGAAAMEVVWWNLVGKTGGGGAGSSVAAAAATGATTNAATPAQQDDLTREAGSYLLKEAGLTVEVAVKDGKLTVTVPGQPTYPLEPLGGRRYKLAPPAPEGFFATFRPAGGDEKQTEIYLEQPQGNYVLSKVKPADATTAPASGATAEYSGPLKEVVGTYNADKAAASIQVAVRDGHVALVVPGQPPYPLVELERDVLRSPALPDAYSVGVRRDAAGRVSGIVLRQPEGEFGFTRAAEFKSPLTVDELMAKVIEAAGGEANLRRHKSMVMRVEADMEHQGVSAEGTVYAKAPNMYSTSSTLTALGKKVGQHHEFFDGRAGGEEASFLAFKPTTGKSLVNARIAADFYGLLNWKTHFKTVEIRKMAKVGDEDVYVVVKTPEGGLPVTDYVSAKTFLVLQQDSAVELPGGASLPVTEKLSDYRSVDGLMIPFLRVSSNVGSGDTTMRVKEVKFDVDVPETEFRPYIKSN